MSLDDREFGKKIEEKDKLMQGLMRAVTAEELEERYEKAKTVISSLLTDPRAAKHFPSASTFEGKLKTWFEGKRTKLSGAKRKMPDASAAIVQKPERDAPARLGAQSKAELKRKDEEERASSSSERDSPSLAARRAKKLDGGRPVLTSPAKRAKRSHIDSRESTASDSSSSASGPSEAAPSPSPSEAKKSKIEDCVICMKSVENTMLLTLPCGHGAHASCLAQWLLSNPSCPYCRRKVEDTFSQLCSLITTSKEPEEKKDGRRRSEARSAGVVGGGGGVDFSTHVHVPGDPSSPPSVNDTVWWQLGPHAEGATCPVPDIWKTQYDAQIARAGEGRGDPHSYLAKKMGYLKPGDYVRMVFMGGAGVYRVKKVNLRFALLQASEGHEFRKKYRFSILQVCHQRAPRQIRWAER